jgi:hypothetical protein
MKARTVHLAATLALLPLVSACSAASGTTAAQTGGSHTVTIKAEVWADNWFAVYSGDTLVGQDSVPITTERSFNSESFTFQASYPLHLNIVAKDYRANDTGLEYIGTARQQMGDGGIVAQFTDVATGKVIAVTDGNARVLVVHKAPLDKACAQEANPVAGKAPCTFLAVAEPAGWKTTAFDDSAWNKASVFTATQVGPKDGYLDIGWNAAARFIWGSDLFTDNTVLIRMTVAAP